MGAQPTNACRRNDAKSILKERCSDIDNLKSIPHKREFRAYPVQTQPQHLPPHLAVDLSRVDTALMVLLMCLAGAVRLNHLTAVNGVIFDEVHYGKFTNWILQGKYFFDVHPVFGKLVIAGTARLLGFSPTDDDFSQVGAPYSSASQILAARLPGALFGTVTIPIFYCLCRYLFLGRPAAALGSLFMLLDSMHIIQSRLVMVDSVLVFFTCAALLSALHTWPLNRNPDCSYRRVYTCAWMASTGVLCGLTFSIRWTAFATPLAVIVISVFGIPPFCNAPLPWAEIGALMLGMCGAYYSSFAIFLIVLTESGSGDVFMSNNFRSCLVNSTKTVATVGDDVSRMASTCNMSLWARVVELNRKIFEYSRGIRGTDGSGSSWLLWILNWRGTLYYRDKSAALQAFEASDVKGRKEGVIYLLMNPAMTVMVNAFILLFVIAVCCALRYRKRMVLSKALHAQLLRGCVLLCGWIVSMLPTMVVYRSGPLYQYLPGLFFAQALAALSFDMFCPKRLHWPVCVVAFFLLLSAFVFWSPWVYGTPLTLSQHTARRWLLSWL